MEVAGAAIGVLGLVGLYGSCIDMLDALSSAARYGVDRELLQTKIEVERVRLMVWGTSVGLATIDLSAGGKNEATEDDLAAIDEGLQRTALRTAVAGLLTCFVRTFEDVEDLQKRYGLSPATPSSAAGADGTKQQQPAREMLTSAFRKTYAHFQERTAASQKQATPLTKATWAVADEKKFRALIAELRAINDSLASLLPAVRDRSRVRIRAEIMQATDMQQLQSLVDASDDVNDLVAETASLRIEMLSTRGPQAVSRKPVPRTVPIVTPPPVAVPQQKVLTPGPPLVIPTTPEPIPVTKDPDPPQLAEPAFVLYDNTGALVVHKVYKTVENLMCYSWLSGIGDAPELSVVQPQFHQSFALKYLSDSILPIADSLLEVDIEADPKYAGWAPGSTSLVGFSRELSFWRKVSRGLEKTAPFWSRTASPIPLTFAFVCRRWKAVVEDGLGKDWTEKKGYDSVRDLCGPSDYLWLDQNETTKIRHQISDLLALMSTSPMPNLENTASIGVLANVNQINPNAGFGFVDFLLQMLLGREVTLRMANANHRWYGGVTVRIVYDLVAAELWSKNLDPDMEKQCVPFQAIRERQVNGILKFAEEMQWPYLSEIQEMGKKLLSPEGANVALPMRAWDWYCGLVLPGAMFPLATIGTLYTMSATLRTRMPAAHVQMRNGNYGLVYPQASYWAIRSILGKVLAPLSLIGDKSGNKIKCLGGWVGPSPSPSLPESTFGVVVELKARPPTGVVEDPKSDDDAPTTDITVLMPQSQQGSAAEWALPTPPAPSTATAVLQTLRLTKVTPAEQAGGRGGAVTGDDTPPIYQARLDFCLANGKLMTTKTLHVNSVFVAAMPCRNGPHRIEPRAVTAYTFRTLSIDELTHAELYGGVAAVTVVNATAGPAAETFARAWCSEKGTNAVVWKREQGCCFKCALMTAGKEGVGAGVLIMC